MRTEARIGSLAVILAVLTLSTVLYAPSARRDGDLGLADAAMEGLLFVGRTAGIRGTVSTDYSNSLEDNFQAIDLFLHSDTRSRLEDVAVPVDESWLGYLVADQLWRLQEAGVEEPLVSEVYASASLLRAFPEMRAHVVGDGAQARFDNTDLKAVQALFELARRRRATAASALMAERQRP
jgi:hypothetical protein